MFPLEPIEPVAVKQLALLVIRLFILNNAQGSVLAKMLMSVDLGIMGCVGWSNFPIWDV